MIQKHTVVHLWWDVHVIWSCSFYWLPLSFNLFFKYIYINIVIMPICLLSKNNFYSIKKPSKLNLRTLFNLDTETMTSQRELIMNDCVVLIILCCVNAKHHLSDGWINLQICTTDDGVFSLFEFWCHQMRCHSVLYCGGSFRCVRVPQAIRALLLNLHFHNVSPSKGIVFFFFL